MEKEINKLFKGENRQFALQLIEIIHNLKEYWALTVRQVYYQAVAGLLIENKDSQYRRVSRVLTRLRRNDLLTWSSIEDRTRRTIDKRGIDGLQEFAEWHAKAFMNPQHYERCYVQKQSVYVEVATEKDALASIVEDAVKPYCTRLNVVRGQVSATMVETMARRFDEAIMKGQKPILLYMGDLDPSGVAIPRALKRNLYEHHSIDIELRRIALNPDQVKKYKLTESPDSAKKQDKNYKAWEKEYGNQSPVELDALHPRDLKELVIAELNNAYDMDSFKKEMDKEAGEREQARRIQVDVHIFLKQNYPDVFAFL